MNKIKVVSVLIIAMLISLTATTIAGAEELEGEIEVEIAPEFLGIIKPRMNLTDNQSITLNARMVEGNASANETDQYFVNDTLTINLNTTGDPGREIFLVQRSVIAGIVMARKLTDIEIMPISGLFQRMFPVIKVASATVIPGILNAVVDSSINISMDYSIDNITTKPSENLTMHIVTMGFLPGDIGGFEMLPIVEYKKISLSVNYVIP